YSFEPPVDAPVYVHRTEPEAGRQLTLVAQRGLPGVWLFELRAELVVGSSGDADEIGVAGRQSQICLVRRPQPVAVQVVPQEHGICGGRRGKHVAVGIAED